MYPEPRGRLGTVNLVPQSALYQLVRSVGLVPIRHVVLHLLGARLKELHHLQGLRPNLEHHPVRPCLLSCP